jgi:hypothetical protein
LAELFAALELADLGSNVIGILSVPAGAQLDACAV